MSKLTLSVDADVVAGAFIGVSAAELAGRLSKWATPSFLR